MYEVQVDDLPEQVYKQLKEMIVDGELQPGQKLIQEELASRLGVSRTPLLTAFRKLEKEMLVELIPRRGAFVRKNTETDLLHVFDIRLKVEPLAARDAAANLTEENLVRIEDAHQVFAEAVRSGDRARYKKADQEFHHAIMDASGNPYIRRMLSSVNLISISNVTGLVTDPSVSLEGHNSILSALKSRNPDAAEEAMSYHLNLSRNKIIKHREERDQ